VGRDALVWAAGVEYRRGRLSDCFLSLPMNSWRQKGAGFAGLGYVLECQTGGSPHRGGRPPREIIPTLGDVYSSGV